MTGNLLSAPDGKNGRRGELASSSSHLPTITTYAKIGRDIETGELVTLGDIERQRGVYILGKPRMGKSWLIVNLLLQDIEKRHGIFFLAPHGEGIESLIKRPTIHAYDKILDAILLDPEDEEHSFGINLLECEDVNNLKDRSDTFTKTKGVFDKLWKETFEEKPWLQLVLQNTIYAFIENQGYTLAEFPLFFRDKAFRELICNNIKYNFVVRDYWLKTFVAKSRYEQNEEMKAAATRADTMLGHPYARDIIGQTKTTLDLRKIIDEKKIVLIKFSSGMSDEDKRIIGTILTTELTHAIRRRRARDQFCIFVDEFQTFAGFEDFSTLITEAPKLGVATTLAHHERSGQFAKAPEIAGATGTLSDKPQRRSRFCPGICNRPTD